MILISTSVTGHPPISSEARVRHWISSADGGGGGGVKSRFFVGPKPQNSPAAREHNESIYGLPSGRVAEAMDFCSAFSFLELGPASTARNLHYLAAQDRPSDAIKYRGDRLAGFTDGETFGNHFLHQLVFPPCNFPFMGSFRLRFPFLIPSSPHGLPAKPLHGKGRL